MRGYLSKETRLQISVTKLKKAVSGLREKMTELVRSNKEKDRRIAELEARLEDKEAQRKHLLTFLYKPGKEKGEGKKSGKRPGAPTFHRPLPKPETITKTETFILHHCPICKRPVGDPVDTVEKYEEDINLAPHLKTTKFIIARHWCGRCETFVKSPDIPPIPRIGLNVLGYILYARYRLRLPMEKVKESLLDLHDFRISEGEIVAKLKEAEGLFGKDHEDIIELIKQAKVVHADETGWRMNGENWWLWAYVTNEGIRFQLEMTRGKGVPKEALGQKQDRVIISDGYAAYQNLPGDKQQCWVHLLRVAKEASFLLYTDLVQLYQELGEALTKPVSERDRDSFEKRLEIIRQRAYKDAGAAKVQKRIGRHAPYLFTCLSYENVLPENNPAERAIRPQVIMRKIFGGCRSPDGAKTHAVNTSVLETLRKRNPNASFFDVVLPILQQRFQEAHSGL